MKTLQELKDHLKEYKDALIIIGPGIQEHTEFKYTSEEFNENYTRKMFRRKPQELWNFYLDKMYNNIDEEDREVYSHIFELSSLTSSIIDQNINSPHIKGVEHIKLHGSIYSWICPKCKCIYASNAIIDLEQYPKCELCDTAIRPTALFVGERYDQALFDKFKDELAKTHTLFLIGVDYTEEPIIDAISQYGLHKTTHNEKNEDKKIIVCIQDKNEPFDPNEIAFCEFLVKDNIESAMERLIKGIE